MDMFKFPFDCTCLSYFMRGEASTDLIVSNNIVQELIAEMAVQCCTLSRIVKRWGGPVLGKLD